MANASLGLVAREALQVRSEGECGPSCLRAPMVVSGWVGPEPASAVYNCTTSGPGSHLPARPSLGLLTERLELTQLVCSDQPVEPHFNPEI